MITIHKQQRQRRNAAWQVGRAANKVTWDRNSLQVSKVSPE